MKHSLRTWRASWRDTLLLVRQFRGPLLFFAVLVIGGGLLYERISLQVGEPTGGPVESVYIALTLIFLQSSAAFPHSPWLQIFYFIMPALGIGALAQGLTEFGILLFNRRARNKEWEMAVASTFKDHTILIGLGHLGFRVVSQLHAMEEPVVVVELNPKADLINAVRAMQIPIIQEDATREAALEAAGIRRARTVLLCTQNDALNLRIAVKARSLNPKVRVVTRIFDDDFANSLQEQFGFQALSATAMAAPAFAAAAAGADVTRPVTVEGQGFSLGRLTVPHGSRLAGMNVGQIEQRYDVSVILLRRNGNSDMHPAGDRHLDAGDTLAVFGDPARINLLVHDCQ